MPNDMFVYLCLMNLLGSSSWLLPGRGGSRQAGGGGASALIGASKTFFHLSSAATRLRCGVARASEPAKHFDEGQKNRVSFLPIVNGVEKKPTDGEED